MSGKVLVTGGAGFIGHHLVEGLINSGYTVYLVDDYSDPTVNPEEHFDCEKRNIIAPMLSYYEETKDPKKPRLLIINQDFSHDSILEKISSSQFFDGVFHLAANPSVPWSVENPLEATEENFAKTLALAKACCESNTRLIFSSSAAVYGNTKEIPTSESAQKEPTNPYGMSKFVSEQYLSLFSQLYDLDCVCLRYFNVYGPRQKGNSPYSTALSAWCNKALNGLQLRSDGDGNQTRDLIHVYDIVSANIHVLEKSLKGFSVFNVGTENPTSNNEILNYFASKGYTDIVQKPERLGDIKHSLSNCKKLKNTGWNTKVSFEKGILDLFKFWGL